MANINRAELRDKIHACFIGKNIGGTIGGPYEHSNEMLNLTGFTTEKGEPMPNDDLDLQMIWLKALEQRGASALTAQMLGEYWLNFISPTWNEYGIAKSNLIAGFMPPFCGEYKNYWKQSNGAWIRSEIWACLAPGEPDLAVKFGFRDACVDHGVSEGTYAEMFTAAMQSAAFVEKDVRKLINIGLSKIPAASRVAQSIHTAISMYDSGRTWQEARTEIVKENEDLGMFMAPQNLGFVVIGLLYGEGDYKKSLLTAVNCGDDTDCTAATVGATLGIAYGTEGIPEDWAEFIGDKIITVAINRGDYWEFPGTVTAFTDHILNQTPSFLYAGGSDVTVSDNPTCFSDEERDALLSQEYAQTLHKIKPYSYKINFLHTEATVEFDSEPKIEPNGEIEFTVVFKNIFTDPRNVSLNFILPEGWSAECEKNVYLRHWFDNYKLDDEPTPVRIKIRAGENVDAINRGILEVTAPGRPTVGYIPLIIPG